MNPFQLLKKYYHSKKPFGIIDTWSVIEKKSFLTKETKETRDWAIQHAGFNNLPYQGKGQRVAILDTGCDIHHPDIKDKVTTASFIQNYPLAIDLVGHGTFVTGEIIAKTKSNGITGAAPEATAFAAKVLKGNSDNLSYFEIAIVNAINEAIIQKCGVISMSLGTSYKSPKIYRALQNAVNNGIIPIAAAGNEGMQGSPYKSYPAAFDNVISVASTNQKDLPAWFSTSGIGDNPLEQPEIAVSSLEYYWGCLPHNQYGKMVGTSMACPLVAAAALLWREAMLSKKIMPSGENVLQEFRNWLRRIAKDTNKNGWDPAIGYGVLLMNTQDL